MKLYYFCLNQSISFENNKENFKTNKIKVPSENFISKY